MSFQSLKLKKKKKCFSLTLKYSSPSLVHSTSVKRNSSVETVPKQKVMLLKVTFFRPWCPPQRHKVMISDFRNSEILISLKPESFSTNLVAKPDINFLYSKTSPKHWYEAIYSFYLSYLVWLFVFYSRILINLTKIQNISFPKILNSKIPGTKSYRWGIMHL